MRLIIVESPKKARTLAAFAGPGYRVVATMGHVRDLPTKGLGLEIGDRIEPQYEVIARARRTVSDIRAAARGAEAILLATDPDREGEAIAWHLAEAAGLPAGRTSRISFHEISDRALRIALAQPRPIDGALVDAQQARRILDRLVGYGLSPLIWRAIQRGTSGGRVQSVALRIIVDREREVRAFVPEEFWTVDVTLSTVARVTNEVEERFVARLVQVGADPARLVSELEALAVVGALRDAVYRVVEVATDASERPPPPPFTTSTLQQAASSRLRLPAKRTMQVAQSLYEAGLITYMRTDSVAVAPDAVQSVRGVIASDFGPGALPASPRQFRTRAKNAQEAHEAIRPVDPTRRPGMVGTLARGDEGRLYALIWSRMVASQMMPARMRTHRAAIEAFAARQATDAPPGAPEIYLLEARATTVVSPGWLAAYGDGMDEARTPAIARRNGGGEGSEGTGDDPHPANVSLPELTTGDVLALETVDPTQRFTRPPSRFSEATLVRALEAAGVGRPSTYATIISTIEERGYVGQSNRAFVPTTLGFAVNDYLARRFPDVVDVQFTARMEDQLDDVAAGTLDWQAMLCEFQKEFSGAITRAGASLGADRLDVARSVAAATIEAPGDLGVGAKAAPTTRRRMRASAPSAGDAGLPDVPGEPVRPIGAPEACPACGKVMVERRSTYGEFWACSGYPKCRTVHRDGITGSSSSGPAPLPTRTGRRASPAMRRARETESPLPTTPALEREGGEAPPPACPRCSKPMIARRSQFGEFWGCSGYPACRQIVRPDGEGPPNSARPRRSPVRGRDAAPDPMTARVVRGRGIYRRPGSTAPPTA